ncbi:MAG: hypothetical protein KAH57_06980 [Thermoplasmata archaeon]|nr:hypothetical protein [Thermoplasmata archaeon]
MTEYAQCRLCGEGDLLPFYGEEGKIAYFCTSCRSRFSGYSKEEEMDDGFSFADSASYSLDKVEEVEEEKEPSLFKTYRGLFRENPPYKGEGKQGYDPEDPDKANLYWADIE